MEETFYKITYDSATNALHSKRQERDMSKSLENLQKQSLLKAVSGELQHMAAPPFLPVLVLFTLTVNDDHIHGTFKTAILDIHFIILHKVAVHPSFYTIIKVWYCFTPIPLS